MWMPKASLVVAVAMTLPLVACGSDGGGSDSSGGEDVMSISVVTNKNTFTESLPHMAQALGIYKKHGLEVDLIGGTAGPANVAAMLSGSADFADVPPLISFPLVADGQKIQFLLNNRLTQDELIVRKAIPLPNKGAYPDVMKDIKGLKVGVPSRGTVAEQIVVQMLEAAGMSAEDVTFVAVSGSPASAATAFLQKEVDVIPTWVPITALVGEENYETAVDRETMWSEVLGEDLISTAWGTTEKTVKERPKAVEAFCKSLRETLETAQDPARFDDVTGFYEEYLNLTPEQASALWTELSDSFKLSITKEIWDRQPEYYPDLEIPSWEKHVYEPCALDG